VFGFKNVRQSGLLRLRLDAGEKTTADAAIKAMRREATCSKSASIRLPPHANCVRDPVSP
jgi:hypothetical protein